MKRVWFLLFIGIFFVGCGSSSLNLTKEQYIKKNIEKSKEMQKKYSKWSDDEKIPLTIVAVGYVNPEIKKTKEYKRYKNVLNLLNKNSTALDSVLGFKLSDKFYPIKVVDFEKGDNLLKFNAAYDKRFDNKDVLTDILRPTNEHPSAEILFRINYNKLQNGVLQIEGYKTIKRKGKKRNSYYYYLVKNNYSKLNDKKQKEAVLQSISAAMQLSIPQYVSIDRKKLLAQRKPLKILTQLNNKKFEGKIYKAKNQLINSQTKEIFFTTPLTEEDLEILYKNKYVSFNNDSDLNKTQINEIITALNRKLLDPTLDSLFPNLISNISDDYIKVKKQTVVIYKKNLYDLDEILTSRGEPLRSFGYKLAYKNKNYLDDDIDNGYAFAVMDYAAKYDNPKFNNAYVQFKDYKVINILEKIPYYEAENLLTTKDIDTLHYVDGKFKTAYSKTSDMHLAWFFVPIGKCKLCKSDFYSVSLGWTITMNIVSIAFAGIGLGYYEVEFDPSKVKKTNFRKLELFKSEAIDE